jgi:hypothetical protein
MRRNVVVINNSHIKGGMYTYAIQLMYGLIKLKILGEIHDLKQIIPNFAINEKNLYHPKKIATKKKRFLEYSFHIDDYDIKQYEQLLQDATDIILIAHVMNDGLGCLSRLPDCKYYTVFHSGADLVNLKRKEMFKEVSSLRYPYISDLIIFRESMSRWVERIADIYDWGHLTKANIIYHQMGYKVNPNPSDRLDRPNNFVWMGRARNLQKRYMRILNAYHDWKDRVDKFVFLTDLTSDVAHWSDVSLFRKAISTFDENKYELIDVYEPDEISHILCECRMGVIPSQYPNIGYPFEWVIQELIANKVPIMATDVIQKEADKYSSGFQFITFETGWNPIEFSILDDNTEDDLCRIAENNYNLMKTRHSCEDMARNILFSDK